MQVGVSFELGKKGKGSRVVSNAFVLIWRQQQQQQDEETAQLTAL
jgi:hypothetical protein